MRGRLWLLPAWSHPPISHAPVPRGWSCAASGVAPVHRCEDIARPSDAGPAPPRVHRAMQVLPPRGCPEPPMPSARLGLLDGTLRFWAWRLGVNELTVANPVLLSSRTRYNSMACWAEACWGPLGQGLAWASHWMPSRVYKDVGVDAIACMQGCGCGCHRVYA